MKLRPQVLPWCNKLLSNSDLKQPFCPTGSVGRRFRTDTEEILVSVLLRVAQRMRGPVAMRGPSGGVFTRVSGGRYRRQWRPPLGLTAGTAAWDSLCSWASSGHGGIRLLGRPLSSKAVILAHKAHTASPFRATLGSHTASLLPHSVGSRRVTSAAGN